MFQYKSNRFYRKQCSFRIPEGYYLDNDEEYTEDKHIKLLSPDLSYDVLIVVDDENKSAEEELSSVISDLKPTIIAPLSEIVVNGLTGYHAKYKNKDGQYFEMWIDFNEEMTFLLLVHTDHDIERIDIALLIEQVDPRVN